MSSHADSQETGNQFDDLVQTRLPLSKVKKIAKIDPNVHMINAEAVKLMAKGTEAFVCLLAKAAFTQAVLDKRKTIQTKDINTVIKQSPVFQLLQGALDDWPEFEKVERSKTTAEGGDGAETVGDGKETAEETETMEETEEAEEETEDTEDDTGFDNETEEEETEEDGDEDKENEIIAESGDSDMVDASHNNESDTLPDTVPLMEDSSSMDHD